MALPESGRLAFSEVVGEVGSGDFNNTISLVSVTADFIKNSSTSIQYGRGDGELVIEEAGEIDPNTASFDFYLQLFLSTTPDLRLWYVDPSDAIVPGRTYYVVFTDGVNTVRGQGVGKSGSPNYVYGVSTEVDKFDLFGTRITVSLFNSEQEYIEFLSLNDSANPAPPHKFSEYYAGAGIVPPSSPAHFVDIINTAPNWTANFVRLEVADSSGDVADEFKAFLYCYFGLVLDEYSLGVYTTDNTQPSGLDAVYVKLENRDQDISITGVLPWNSTLNRFAVARSKSEFDLLAAHPDDHLYLTVYPDQTTAENPDIKGIPSSGPLKLSDFYGYASESLLFSANIKIEEYRSNRYGYGQSDGSPTTNVTDAVYGPSVPEIARVGCYAASAFGNTHTIQIMFSDDSYDLPAENSLRAELNIGSTLITYSALIRNSEGYYLYLGIDSDTYSLFQNNINETLSVKLFTN